MGKIGESTVVIWTKIYEWIRSIKAVVIWTCYCYKWKRCKNYCFNLDTYYIIKKDFKGRRSKLCMLS